MKQLTLVLIFASILAACNNSNTSNNTTNKNLEVASESATVKYHCPMNCQGDTSYTTAGQCPICEMDLEKR